MPYLPETAAAILLATVTLLVQCIGITILIGWAVRAVASPIQKLASFRLVTLMLRFTTTIIALHAAEILLWAAWYRWACFASWESSLYFSATSFSTVGYGDMTLPPKWRMLGPLEGLLGVLMCGVSVSLLFAIIARLVGRASGSPK